MTTDYRPALAASLVAAATGRDLDAEIVRASDRTRLAADYWPHLDDDARERAASELRDAAARVPPIARACMAAMMPPDLRRMVFP